MTRTFLAVARQPTPLLQVLPVEALGRIPRLLTFKHK
jgi:hypothetical protein